MGRRKGELTAARINTRWPHQIALKELDAKGQYDRAGPIRELVDRLAASPRGHTVYHEAAVYNVYCFATPEDARTFQELFGGEPFDPRDRGTGHMWGSWYKGRAAAMDAKRR